MQGTQAPRRARQRKPVLRPPGVTTTRPVRHRARRLVLLPLTLAALAAVGLALLATAISRPRATIARDVTVAGVSVEGCTEAQAVARIERDWVARLPRAVDVTWPGGSRQIAHADLGVALLVRQAARSALHYGTEGSITSRIRVALRIPGDVTDIPVRVDVDQERLRQTLAQLREEVSQPARDASITLDGDRVAGIVPEVPGQDLDLVASVQAVGRALADPGVTHAALAVHQTAPVVTRKDLDQIDGVLASYTTRFRAWQRDRSHNVRLAASQIKCVLLMPGDTVSLNSQIGPRLEKLGYKEAPIFVNGEVEPSTGGGICQVATTVYNAVLLAGLDVVERHHHSRPVDYAPAGRDATLYWGQCDLRIRNNLRAPVVLAASAGEGSLTVRVMGDSADRRDVSIERTGLSRIPHGTKEKPDPTLPAGKRKVDKPGRDGTRVTVTRVVRGEGGVDAREVLHTDVYAPADEVVLVGTQPVPVPGNELTPPGEAIPAPAAQPQGARPGGPRSPKPAASPARKPVAAHATP